MTFDRIEWDEHNLGHATGRLTAAEIEQAIWARTGWMFPHREHPDGALFGSLTDGGNAVVVIEIVRDGIRPAPAQGDVDR